MIKKSIQKEDTSIINIYVPNIGPPKHIKQILTIIKGETDSYTTTENFNTSLTSMDRLSRQKTQEGNTGLKEHSRPDI